LIITAAHHGDPHPLRDNPEGRPDWRDAARQTLWAITRSRMLACK
jgi:hypothetical protein